MSDLNTVQLQIPIMYAFREAYRARDAKVAGMVYRDGERVLTDRGRSRRRGADEQTLKRNLAIDLLQLANTINLAAAADLTGLDYVRRSILNYGVPDLSALSANETRLKNLPDSLRRALLDNEPRFIRESMTVTLAERYDDVEQKLRFDIHAEMACRPVDIPLEFIAEIDVGSGKLKFANVSSGQQ